MSELIPAPIRVILQPTNFSTIAKFKMILEIFFISTLLSSQLPKYVGLGITGSVI